jgi:hypothetical protein
MEKVTFFETVVTHHSLFIHPDYTRQQKKQIYFTTYHKLRKNVNHTAKKCEKRILSGPSQ